MIAGAMAGWRNPARSIAPLALAAAVTVTYLVVHHALMHKHSGSTPTTLTQTTGSRHSSHKPSGSAKAKFYIVKSGDSLLKIAHDTGVSITSIEELNPKLNPNSLHPSQRIRLR